MSGFSRSQLIDEIHRREVELAQEEFYLQQLPEKRQRAFIGIGLNLMLIVAAFFLGIFFLQGVFPLVPIVICIFLIMLIIYFVKLILKEMQYIASSQFQSLINESRKKKNEMKKELDQLRRELSETEIKKWNP